MSLPYAFIDTETTSLDAETGEIWEAALIEPDGTEHQWFLPVDLGRADPLSLRIGRYYERHPDADGTGLVSDPLDFAYDFSRLTADKCHLIGAVISFDEERLRKLLRANGACPDWAYHLVDVEALIAGMLAIPPPWDSTELSLAVGVKPDEFEKHTAVGDALWAKALYEAVMASPRRV